jgi:hypothetical protein
MKNLISKIKAFFATNPIVKYAKEIIKVTEQIKQITNNQKLNFFVENTPNKIDDAILVAVNKAAIQVTKHAEFALHMNDCVNSSHDLIEQINCVFEGLKRLDKSKRNRFYLKTAERSLRLLLQAKENIYITTEEAEKIIEEVYHSK